MCIFSGPVNDVGATKIFARKLGEERQCIIYQMHYRAQRHVAMVLPLPVRIGAGEEEIAFYDFSHYPKFFADLEASYPEGHARSLTKSAPLKVHDVGNFEASFAPILADMDRLDDRFRLPAEVWSNIPQVETFGFVVAKLKPGDLEVHPLAFSFPSRLPRQVFFPTLHIHDGMVHRRASFDHGLYTQEVSGPGWKEAKLVRTLQETYALVDLGAPILRREVIGFYKNEDTYVDV